MYVCVFTFSQSASAGKAKTMPFGASAGEPIHTTSLQTKQVDSESTSIAFGVVFLTGVGFGAGVGVGLGVTDGVGLGVTDGVGCLAISPLKALIDDQYDRLHDMAL